MSAKAYDNERYTPHRVDTGNKKFLEKLYRECFYV